MINVVRREDRRVLDVSQQVQGLVRKRKGSIDAALHLL